ncbi:hypothetical protein BAE30_05170 [Acidithiobacillus caldus]|uniref:RNA polymerase sigma-70 region 4 domain-containing protein n=1 Tax=Acidithiobacillus caldus TaxID=33059 RepID=A0A1E7YXW8_9PROT|nr:hypothetical protein BAE30_05170 [Acidithiobacillus caldus]
MTTSTFALDALATDFLVRADGPHWATQHERVQYRSGAADIIFLAEDENYTCEQDVERQEIERDELAQKILDSLFLSRKQRRVWEYIFDGYSQAEISRKIGISAQAISKIIAETREHVKFHAQIVMRRESLAGGERLPMRDASSSDFCPPPIPDGFVGQLVLFGGDL